MKFYITIEQDLFSGDLYFKRIDNNIYIGKTSIIEAIKNNNIARSDLTLEKELLIFNRKIIFLADITYEDEINSENFPELFI